MHKTITLKTNYNQKIGCDNFLHIDLAPAGGIPESKLNGTVIEIRTMDNSHPPVKTKLVNLVRLPLWKICDLISYPSHGMDSVSFQAWMVENNEKLNADSPLAVYFYQRIKE